MNISYRIIFITLLFIFLCKSSYAQNLIIKNLKEYKNQISQEKLYLNTDRSAYMAGDILWFKISLLDASTHQPLDLSKVVYVELLSREGEPVIQKKVAIQDGFGNGSIYLPVFVNTGNYLIRAYTSWMKNFSSELFFEKSISIVNTFVIPEVNTYSVSDDYLNIDFYPEGGHLVQGIPGNVAFKVTGSSGKGVDVEGYLLSSGDTIAHFSTYKYGIGTFEFTPDANADYSVSLTSGDSIYLFHQFADIKLLGYTMDVEDQDNLLYVTVHTNYNNASNIFLVGHTRQQVKIAEVAIVENGKAVFSVDKSQLGEGISHLTVFDQGNQPVAERLLFKQLENTLNIQLEIENPHLSKREKGILNIQADHSATANANLSTSIFLLDSLQVNAEPGIIPYLFLTSELKGQVESPEYYFNNPDDEKAIDNLMLTHGWRRFNWEELRAYGNEESYSNIPELEGHIVTAKVNSENLRKDDIAFLSIPGKVIQLYVASVDDKGIARFVTNELHGVKNIILQPDFNENNEFNFEIVSPFYRADTAVEMQPLILGKELKETLRKRSIFMQAQNIYLKEKRNEVNTASYLDSIPFYGSPTKRYLLDDYTRFPTMVEVMREYVYEVSIRKKGDKYNFKVFNSILDTYFDQNPLVLLDGALVSDINKIIEFDPIKIKSLDIITGKYMLGSNVWFDGIVSYSTYKGDMGGLELNPSQVQINYEGLQLKREFYIPDYSKSKGDKRLPDFRSLLFWDPEIITDEEGKAIVEFYTSDIPGDYIIVVEGITQGGIAGENTIKFSVE